MEKQEIQLIKDIGNKYGLMMHDPIQSHHIGKAIVEYTNLRLKRAENLLKHCRARMDDLYPRFNSTVEMVDEYLNSTESQPLDF